MREMRVSRMPERCIPSLQWTRMFPLLLLPLLLPLLLLPLLLLLLPLLLLPLLLVPTIVSHTFSTPPNNSEKKLYRKGFVYEIDPFWYSHV
jgi:hypothetical protein